MKNALLHFDGKDIRRTKHDGEWYYSVVDVIEVLTESNDSHAYWRKLKQRETELVTNCHGLKLYSSDGKLRLTDCATTKSLFRIIQSIPSKKAEPFKRWLAKVGYERVQEINDPRLAYERMRKTYLLKGYSPSWIEHRLRSMQIRDELTNEWKQRGVAGKTYSILSNEISKATFDLTPREYKEHKGLVHQSLRDHMDSMELVLTMLGEATTTKLTRARDSKKFSSLQKDAQDGGNVAGKARKDIEKRIGKTVVSSDNFLEETEKVKKL